MKTYILNLLYILDKLVNAIFWGRKDKTISYRWARGRNSGCWLCRNGCKALEWLDPGHCDKSLKVNLKE